MYNIVGNFYVNSIKILFIKIKKLTDLRTLYELKILSRYLQYTTMFEINKLFPLIIQHTQKLQSL